MKLIDDGDLFVILSVGQGAGLLGLYLFPIGDKSHLLSFQ